MGHTLLLSSFDPAAWVGEHPVATLVLLGCGAVALARAFYLYTRTFLERFEELPDPRSLSTPELVVLANPRELTRAHLERLDRRWRGAGRLVVLVATGTLALLGADAVLGRELPRAALLERLDTERAELTRELDHRAALAPDLTSPAGGFSGGPRAEELAARLERTLALITARDDRGAFDEAERARVELAACALARAGGRFAAVLDLVPEEQLARANDETERQLEREAALLVERARALAGLGETRRALPHLERALALRPARLDVALDLAQAYVVCGRVDAAMARLEETAPALARAVLEEGRLERASELVRARALEGQAHTERGDDERAHAAYSAALALIRRGDLFEPSARLDADLARLLRARAAVAGRLARTDEARVDLEHALALHRASVVEPGELGGRIDLAELLLAHAQLMAGGGDPRGALAELDEARALVDDGRVRSALFESARGRLLPVELELASVRVLQELGELERAHDRLDAQIARLDAATEERPELDRVRAEAALLHAAFGLAARSAELALADVARALDLLAREAGRGVSGARLDALRARAEELRASALALQAPVEVAPELEVLPDSSGPVSSEPVAIEVAEPEPPAAPAPPGALAQLDLRLAAWDAELEGEEDPLLLAAPVADLLERARLQADRGASERAVADLDRAVHLLRERLGVEPPESVESWGTTLELARALGARGAQRARAGRFALAFRDYDERVDLLGGRAAATRDAAHARALADALRERALVAFNRGERAAALADLDAAVVYVEAWLGAVGDELTPELDARLADLRRERALVQGAAGDGERR